MCCPASDWSREKCGEQDGGPGGTAQLTGWMEGRGGQTLQSSTRHGTALKGKVEEDM